MIKYILSLFIILVCSAALFAQANIDSLETVLSQFSGTDEEKINLLNEIAFEYRWVLPEKAIKYGQQALALSHESDYSKGEATALNYIGTGYCIMGSYNKALEYYLKSLEIWEDIGDNKNTASLLNNIGNSYIYSCDYEKALEYHLKSLKIKEEIGNKIEIAGSLINIGIIYSSLKDYEKALVYLIKSLKINEKIGDKNNTGSILNNLGIVYEKLNKYEQALKYYFRSLKINEEIGDKNGIAISLNNIGIVYNNLNNYDEALKYYFRSLEIDEEIDNLNGIINSLNNIGETYINLNNYNKALPYIERGLKLAEEIKAKNLVQESYKLLSDLYSAKGDFRKAFEYHKLCSEVKDSIFTKESSEKIAEMQTKYDTEKKEKENELLRKDNEIQKLEITRRGNVRDFLIIISGLILVLVLITYSRYRTKKKANIILSKNNLQITEQKNNLSATLGKLRESHKIIEEKTEELKKSEEQYRTLFESAEDAIFLMKDGIFIDCNPATEEMFGCSREEIIGHYPYEFSPSLQPDGRESKEKAFENINLALGGKHQFFEWVHCRPDGSAFETEVSLNRMKINEEIVLLAIIRDITERKLAEKKLQESEKRSTLLEKEIINLHEKQAGERRILGESEPMKNMFTMIDKVAETDAAVLIYGETGTGKESVAHAIHSASFRKNKPLGIIDCGSIPAGLLESELFGHEKGAFTGAYAMRKGLFETSDGGTVLLDEISEVPLNLQSSLLRVLQEKDIRRVGGTKRIKVNVRVIAASNKHLKPLVETGKFRDDLYYRLSVIPVEIPPLRERSDDIMLLAHYFLGHFGRNNNKIGFTNDAESVIKSYHWPGNVRELQHKIEKAVILSDSEYLSAKDIELNLELKASLPEKEISEENNSSRYLILVTEQDFIMAKNSPKGELMNSLKKNLINEAIKFTDNNIKEAARLLGINRDTIRRIKSSE